MSFAIYSDNAKPLNIELSIKWNGKWESRLTEMNQISLLKKRLRMANVFYVQIKEQFEEVSKR